MASVSVESKLSGTLGERHKILNQLVKDAAGEELSLEFIHDTSGKKQVDLIYLARLANYTKNASVICQLLKSQDGMVVSVAMHSKWFFTAATHPKYINVQYFADEIFPYASFHTICRIVSNFGAHLQVETVAEDFYKYIYKCHGRKMAIKLLPKCSVEFIRHQIMEVLVDVPCTQMYSIYKKNPGLALEYLEKYYNKERTDRMPLNYSWGMDYSKILKNLAKDDTNLFTDFVKRHKDNISNLGIGQKITKQALKRSPDIIVDNPDLYSDILKRKTIVRSLQGQQLEKYLLNSLPNTEEDFYGGEFEHLKLEQRFKILTKLYPMKYNGALLTDSNCIECLKIYSFLSDEDRIAWVKKTIEKTKTRHEEHYVQLMPVKEGIPRLQNLCKSSNDSNDRTSYVTAMVECCKVNNDKQTLLDVLKYIAQRYRNDVVGLRYSFLNKIKESFTLHELSSDHWKIINEMIDFLCAEKEIEKNNWNEFAVQFAEQYIKFCSKSDLNYEPYVDKIILFEKSGNSKSLENLKYDTKVFDMFFDKYKKLLVHKKKSVAQDDDESDFKIVSYLVNSLCTRKDKSLMDYPWLLDFIKKNNSKWSESDKEELFGQIAKDKKAKEIFVNEIYEYVFDALRYVKLKPDIIMSKMEQFLKGSASKIEKKCRYNRIYGKIHAYLMDPLGECIVEALKERMKDRDDDDADEVQQLAIDIFFLSHLIASEETKKLLEEHAPSELKVDLENNRKEYGIGQIFGSYMGDINPPVEYSTLMCYAGGDYFKYSLRSLLMLAHKKPINETKTLIHELTNKPVSIKKHSIRLAYSLCPREELLPFYKSLWEVEKNSSIREVIFTFTHKLMMTEEDIAKYNKIWETLKYFMSTFTDMDKNLFSHLSKSINYKRHIVGEYCEFCWSIVKKLASEKVDVGNHISRLAKSFSHCMEFLSEELCESIIAEYKNCLNDIGTKKNMNEFGSFLIIYLINAKDIEVQSKHVSATCEFFKDFVLLNWNTKVDDEFEHRKIIKNFVFGTCRKSIKTDLTLSPINVLKSLSEMLYSTVPFESIKLRMTVNLTILYRELLSEPRFKKGEPSADLMNAFGQKIALYLNDLCLEHGADIERIFKDSYSDFKSFMMMEMYRFELHVTSGLIEKTTNRQCFLMAIDLLPGYVPSGVEDNKLYFQIIDRIKAEGDGMVKMILNNKFDR